MSDWLYARGELTMVKVGSVWLRVSAIEAVRRANSFDGVIVHLAGGTRVDVVGVTPDELVEALSNGVVEGW